LEFIDLDLALCLARRQPLWLRSNVSTPPRRLRSNDRGFAS
jgi:hypothetical protein